MLEFAQSSISLTESAHTSIYAVFQVDLLPGVPEIVRQDARCNIR